MNEQRWLVSEDFAQMLEEAAGRPGILSERKLCLICDALVPHLSPDRPAAWLLKWATAQTRTELARACSILREVVGNPWRPVDLGCRCRRCVRPGEQHNNGPCRRTRCLWLTPTVVSLAQAAYDERLPPAKCVQCGGTGGTGYGQFGACPDCKGAGVGPSGHLDPARLAVLADALEEAGCTSEALLRHLRGWEPVDCEHRWHPSDAPHVRGCWALDTILGRV